MKWNDIIDGVDQISPQQVKEYIENHPSGSFQLIDVRQPEEYEEMHIPGGLLIPLDKILAHGEDIEKGKPAIIYCRSGRRSQAAAQHLLGQGFEKVMNMEGGILAWKGHVMAGSVKNRLALLPEDADFAGGVEISYAMEEGLQRLYKLLAERSNNHECIAMLETLADFEKGHKEALMNIVSTERAASPGGTKPEKVILEGGFDLTETLENVSAHINDLFGIVDLAMALEVQAHDFYINLARLSKVEATKAFFLKMADEEKNHFAYILREFRQGLS